MSDDFLPPLVLGGGDASRDKRKRIYNVTYAQRPLVATVAATTSHGIGSALAPQSKYTRCSVALSCSAIATPRDTIPQTEARRDRHS
ncbi:hypothetical protein E2C01_090058 [Portunus trituberculatus]|uniref:Uncharacterized protein n=1 Tax=Portunus trituberculatus TaxID=210409 RepID=A0A5B7JP49_PORTR|nr:hypothetical protein [Portunus trituberculatus]